MAIINSLVCWGGITGKVVSISASTDVVTLTRHGLQNGTKLWPSGTLPSELNTSTPVYARSTGSNTFTLHASAAGAIANTGQILFAGSSTYGAVTLKSDLVASPSTALSAYGLSDLSRWWDSGLSVYRVYDGLASWYTARNSATNGLYEEIVEIGEAFDDIFTANANLPTTCARIEVVSKIAGKRTPGFHSGNKNAGYRIGAAAGWTMFSGISVRYAFDGIVMYGSGYTGFVISYPGTEIRYCILTSTSKGTYLGVICQVSSCVFAYNWIEGFDKGFRLDQSTNETTIANNLLTGNNYGMFPNATTVMRGMVVNNIAYGNTTSNWGTVSPAQAGQFKFASGNAGASGDVPWKTTGGTEFAITNSDFVDFTNGNFNLASSSALIDGGTGYYGSSAYVNDLAGDEVPNYNNGGAEGIDVGPFEYDHGYGPRPATHTLTLINVVVGSRVHIRDQADTVTHYDDIASASSVVIPITVYGDTRDNLRIKVRKASAAPYYQPWETIMTATAGASSIYVSQIPD